MRKRVWDRKGGLINSMKKRGLSMVVATVLILLLTLVLASILAQVLIPFVKNNLKQSTECVPYQNYFQFDSSFDFNCYELNNGAREYKISVKSIAAENLIEEDIAGFNLVVGKEGSSKTVPVKKGATESCEVDNVKNLESSCTNLKTLEIPSIGEGRTYIYSTNDVIKYFELGAILNSGRECEISDKINQIPKCGAG